MHDCKNININQTNESDTFDHPNYNYFCKKKHKSIIPCCSCQPMKCPYYESTNTPFFGWYIKINGELPLLPPNKGKIVLHPETNEQCFQADDDVYHKYYYPINEIHFYSTLIEAKESFNKNQGYPSCTPIRLDSKPEKNKELHIHISIEDNHVFITEESASGCEYQVSSSKDTLQHICNYIADYIDPNHLYQIQIAEK